MFLSFWIDLFAGLSHLLSYLFYPQHMWVWATHVVT